MSNVWIVGNRFLTETEMRNNATNVWNYLGSQGWTANAVAALLGNMEAESTINPGIWEGLTTDPEDWYNTRGYYPGFGLVQWTPYTKIQNWILETYGTTDYSNGYHQLSRIVWELDNNEQYGPTAAYPETFREFSRSTREPAYLAEAFLINYERPDDHSESVKQYRGQLANQWYTYITGLPAPEFHRIPIWLLFKMRGG